jgi:hypothetical protein
MPENLHLIFEQNFSSTIVTIGNGMMVHYLLFDSLELKFLVLPSLMVRELYSSLKILQFVRIKILKILQFVRIKILKILQFLRIKILKILQFVRIKILKILQFVRIKILKILQFLRIKILKILQFLH